MNQAAPPPDDRPRSELNWARPLALLGAIVGYNAAVFVWGIDGRYWAVDGAVLGVIAKPLLPAGSREARLVGTALQLLLWLGLAVLLVTLIVFSWFLVRELT
ncbi:MAG: hypothetical protein JNM56_20710 [Planctomycetia bacterium]|nr:hypothetical protein [Planctomycetia bacterium]